jgi:hypothetical protein
MISPHFVLLPPMEPGYDPMKQWQGEQHIAMLRG